MKYFVIFLFIAILFQNLADAQNSPSPENVLVVYKSQDPNNPVDTISVSIANYYKNVRGIPSSNIVHLDNLFNDDIYDPETQTTHSIILDQDGEMIKDNTSLSYNPINRHSWLYFVDRIAAPIAEHLRTTFVNGTPLKDIIRFIVLCKGVPFRIITHPDDGGSCNQNVAVDGLLCFLGEDINVMLQGKRYS